MQKAEEKRQVELARIQKEKEAEAESLRIEIEEYLVRKIMNSLDSKKN